ncbi:Retrovirus-related Pol polyprotein like [Argiope bruennichi]|uniref:Retrovirus-related Pol polyprotein like n=1 Tax=Argiope bruennichi TaxID=94029 RepID=A0A8T0FIZ6_ARGBR|nr:Retrovirus-related Pol polyprotein like [Argiope bruennichi]
MTLHDTVHHIITKGLPITAKPRRLHPKLHVAVKAEFEFLLEQGIIRPSKRPWSSPLHVFPKSDSTVRPVGDYKRLNAITEFDSYTIPHLHDFCSGTPWEEDILKAGYLHDLPPDTNSRSTHSPKLLLRRHGDYLWNDFRESFEPEISYAAAICEVDTYFKDKYLAPQEDPLKYWTVNKLRFLRLYKLMERRLYEDRQNIASRLASNISIELILDEISFADKFGRSDVLTRRRCSKR